MKAAWVSRFGAPDEVVEVVEDAPRPTLRPGKKEMLIKVQACSFTPADWRTIKGEADLFRHPDFPYIPGLDVAGIVEEVQADEATFHVGDLVLATWPTGAFGMGGLAEYAVVQTKHATVRPATVSPIVGAALVNSPAYARWALAKMSVRSGDRVLILGGCGGVGSLLVQLARQAGAGFIAATSTQTDLLKELNVDLAIDYTQENWWEMEQFQGDGKLDVIVDCAQGQPAWRHARKSKVIKTGHHGGRYVTLVSSDWKIIMHNAWDLVKFIVPMLYRPIYSRMAFAGRPKYMNNDMLSVPMGKEIQDTLAAVENNTLRIIVDKDSPHPFTTEGVRAALNKLGERKGHAKIVVQIADEGST